MKLLRQIELLVSKLDRVSKGLKGLCRRKITNLENVCQLRERRGKHRCRKGGKFLRRVLTYPPFNKKICQGHTTREANN